MIRYFFDVQYDGHSSIDDEGTELDSVEAAGIEAVEAMGELALEKVPGTEGITLGMNVRDETGVQRFALDLAFTFRRTG